MQPNSLIMMHNLVVVGGRGGNSAVLKTRLDPMKLEDGMGIAATTIAVGEIANITKSNNEFKVELKAASRRVIALFHEARDPDSKNDSWMDTLRIPEGRYERKEDVLWEICGVINDYLTQLQVDVKCSVESAYEKRYMTMPNILNLIVDDEGPWPVIDAHKGDDKVWVFSGELKHPTEMGFLYMNIVEDSYINGKKSRMLAVFPIRSVKGYTHFEFETPIYVPIEIKEFSEIDIELRDIKGIMLKIDNSYDTVISMHIKSINRAN